MLRDRGSFCDFSACPHAQASAGRCHFKKVVFLHSFLSDGMRSNARKNLHVKSDGCSDGKIAEKAGSFFCIFTSEGGKDFVLNLII